MTRKEKKPDTKKKNLRVRAQPNQDDSENITGIAETCSDIVREKQSAEELETIWNVSLDLLCVADFHTATFLKVNPAFRKVLGYRETEMLSRSFMDFVHPEDVQSTRAIIEDKLKHGETVLDFTNRYRCKDGTYRYLQWISRPLKEKGITYAIARDITRQRNAELSLQREKAWSERIIDYAPNIVIGLGAESRIRVFNKYIEELTGYKAEEVIGREWIGLFIAPEQREEIRRIWDEIVESKATDHHYEAEILTRSKERRLIEWKNTVLSEGGEFYMVLSLGLDITDRRKTEKALREKESLLRSTGRIAKVGGWEIDARSRQVKWTEETYRIHEVPPGYNPSLGDALEFFHPHDRGVLAEAIERALRKGEPYDMEVRFITAKGRQLWTRAICEPLFKDGKVVTLKGIFHDITAGKNAEIQLRESEKKLQILLDQAPAALFLHKMDGSIVDYNKLSLETYGYSREELLKLKSGDIDPDYQEREDSGRFWQELTTKKQVRFEARHKKKDGTVFPVEVHLSPIEINDEKYVLALAADITARKLSQQALRESEEKYRTLVNSTLQGVVISKSDPIRIVFANPAMAGISGFTPERLVGMKPDELSKLIHEDDRERFFTNFRKRIQGLNIPQSSEYRLVAGDGSVKWVALFSSRIEYEKEPAILTTFMDITERKRALEDLRESERQYAFLAETAFDLVELRSIQNIYAYTAGKLQELMGNMGIVVIVEYDMDANRWKMKHMRGVSEKHVELSKIFGFDIGKMEGEIGTRYYEQIMSGRLEEMEFDFPGFFNNRISHAIGEKVKQLVSADKMYCIAFQENEKIYGNITLIPKKNARPLNAKLIESFVLQVTNFVKKQKSEEALKSSETKFRTLVEQASEMLFLHDLHGNLVEVNEAAVQATGYPREELEKMNVLEIDPDATARNDSRKIWVKRGPDDPSITFESRHQRKDGSIYPAEITLSKVGFSGKQYILALARDITERKKAEEALRKVKENLEIEVADKTRELQERVMELERFHDATIEREFRIKELKDEIERLKADKK